MQRLRINILSKCHLIYLGDQSDCVKCNVCQFLVLLRSPIPTTVEAGVIRRFCQGRIFSYCNRRIIEVANMFV